MKKLLITIVFLLAIGYGSVNAQVVWGGRIGLSYPTWMMKSQYGFELGPVLYYSLGNNFYLNSGAMFNFKAFDDGNVTYLDIPLYVGYSFPVGSSSLYAQTGPFIGIKLADTGSESDERGFDSASFNAGVGIMAGINLNRFKVELGYQAGLVNVIDYYRYSYSHNHGDYYYDYYHSDRLSSVFIGVSYVF
jgi:hypothetical protein